MQYVKLNGEGNVVALTSEEYLPNENDWVPVDNADELIGGELVDRWGTPLYTVGDGRIITRFASDIESANAEKERASEIDTLKASLKETDYIAVKIAEGAATADEYADIIFQRRLWRARINTLEQEG